MAQGALQHDFDRRDELANLPARQMVGAQFRINSRRVERFIDVDVSKPGDELLVEQCCLDEALGALESWEQIVNRQ